jgi:molybdate transport system substrate-binding protein
MRKTAILWGLGAALALCGCGDDGGGGGGATGKPRELLIFVGAGIRQPCAELVASFEKQHGVRIVPDYAGSEVLISKIRLARRGDVYMPGDRHYVDQAAEAGMISSQKSVCFFVPTIMVQKGNPKGIASLKDLLKPGLKLGLGDAKACAIGRKSRKIFEKNGISWTAVQKNLRYQSLTVNELGIQIETRSLDAVIVWDAVAKQYARTGEEVAIPVSQNVISTVNAGVLSFSKHPELAAKFVDFAAGSEGQAIFKKHNYCTTAPR